MMPNFKFFVGVVEDTFDPLKINRVRVRAVGVHPESRAEVDTGDLPWAPLLSTTANMSAPMLNNGDWVFGFFMDGEDAQQPVVIGSMVSIPVSPSNPAKGFNDPNGVWPQYTGEGTNSRLARNERVDDQTPIGRRKLTRIESVTTASSARWQEPETQYAAAYPMNKVLETESGHVLEFDDTPGKERVHVYHRSGSFMELYPDGKVVYKATNNSYDLTIGDKNVYAAGRVNISCVGQANIVANGGVTVSTKDGDVNIRGKNINIEATDSMRLLSGTSTLVTSNGKVAVQAATDVSVQSGSGQATIKSARAVNLSAPRINAAAMLSLSRTAPAGAQSLNISPRPVPLVETHSHQRQERVDRYRVTPPSSAISQAPAGGWPAVDASAAIPPPQTPVTPSPVTPPQAEAPDLECGSPPARTSGLYVTPSTMQAVMGQPAWADAWARGLALIRQFEGFESNMYLDAVRVPTIGWGFTAPALNSIKSDPRVSTLSFFQSVYTGSSLQPGMAITRADADRLLEVMVEKIYLRAVLSSSTGVISSTSTITPYMAMALTSFTFNLGAGNLQRSTLRRLINETTASTDPSQFTTIAQQFMLWTKADGEVLRGLVRRRQAEKCLFLYAG